MNDPLYWVSSNRIDDDFPTTDKALKEPDGLLAVGGDLSAERLLRAYRLGIFPWYSDGQPILWWAPDPRSVMRPGEMKVSRSLRKRIGAGGYRITTDLAFHAVVDACAAPRDNQSGTWITDPMKAAYGHLHQCGHAHSVEYWQGDDLVGGLYGVSIGRVFFGESMFSTIRDASKVAMAALSNSLKAWDYELIDCQIHNPHLASLGAVTIPRARFSALIDEYCDAAPAPSAWRLGEIAV